MFLFIHCWNQNLNPKLLNRLLAETYCWCMAFNVNNTNSLQRQSFIIYHKLNHQLLIKNLLFSKKIHTWELTYKNVQEMAKKRETSLQMKGKSHFCLSMNINRKKKQKSDRRVSCKINTSTKNGVEHWNVKQPRDPHSYVWNYRAHLLHQNQTFQTHP